MSGKQPIRVFLADDHTLVRAGVRRILEAHSGMRVVGEAGDGEAALQALAATEADVLVLDLSMPGADGFRVLRAVREKRPGLKVIVLTMHAGREYVERAVREGADGYLLKDSAAQDLVEGVHAVMEGRVFYSPQVQRELTGLLRGRGEGEAARQGFGSLTDREREVLRLVARGLATKEIAAQLSIGSRTVETHRANLMRKLDLRSVALLTQFAIKEGLIEAP